MDTHKAVRARTTSAASSQQASKQAKLSGSRKAETLVLKALIYIILAVGMVIIACVIFFKLWNVFIGRDVVESDAQLIGKIIGEMNKQEAPYLQQPFFVQSQDDIIVGFDAAEQSINLDVTKVSPGSMFGTNPPPRGTVFTKPAQCTNKACICVVRSGVDLDADTCFTLADNVFLATDYAGYRVNLQEKNLPVYERADVAVPERKYTVFTLGKRFAVETNTITTQDNTKTTQVKPKAIVPYVIEKHQLTDGAIIITMLPQSGYVDERAFSLQVCGADSTPECIGKTGRNSYSSATHEYCAVNILNNKCKKTTLASCSATDAIRGLCDCQGTILASGYCISCAQITKCEDYCSLSGDTSAYCFNQEEDICRAMPCPGVQNCKATTNDIGTYCSTT